MTIGERLRSERERLRLSQPACAAIAGTTKQTLFSWESGKTAPDGFQLAALAEAGMDVFFVLTGEYVGGMKPQPALDAEEQTLLGYFREASRDVRRAALGALIGAAPAAAAPAAPRDLHMSGGGVQIGVMRGGRVKPAK